MKVVSLFSGGGMGDLGFLMAGCEIVAQVEIDEYCQKILAMRYPDAKKFKDIRTVKGTDLPECDIITGGFPCQPFSVAGKQKGANDNRHLWPEMFRVIKECRPRWIVGENVPGIINLALDSICVDLESEGYEVWPIVFPSHALGAWHKRDRVWIICHTKHPRQSAPKKQRSITQRGDSISQGQNEASESTGPGKQHDVMANARLLGQEKSKKQTMGAKQLCKTPWRNFWFTEPAVGRVVDGCPNRIHRLKLLGNGQVPACTEWIARKIIEFDHNQVMGQ